MIKIDMGMPESCSLCKFMVWVDSSPKMAMCIYSDYRIKKTSKRLENCPLLECEYENI